MSKSFQIKIEPYEFYNKYASQDYVLCGIRFDFFEKEKHSFHSECSNKCLSEIMSAIDDYFNGKIAKDTELYYDVPWIMGGVDYPFSFEINVEKKQWIFRYKKQTNAAEFDFEYPMDESAIRDMYAQIEKQYAEMEWSSLGKSHLYTFDLPQKEFEWCYSAKAFNEALNELCKGRKIEAIYVSATNYADPLRVSENYVNYYVGSEIFIQMEGVLLNLLIFACGLFKWRSFDNSEITVTVPRLDFIQNGDEEFCKIDDVYRAFKLEYRKAKIANVTVNDTDCWPWDANGFDESQLGDPIELPEEIFFNLENGNTLSFVGWDDDFAIRIKESKGG